MKLKRKLKTGVALAAAAALTVSVLPVNAMAAVSYTAPDQGMEVDNDTYLSGATAQANTVVLSLLGINVASTNLNALTGSGDGTDSSYSGIMGSDINDNPDPYIYNFFYNLYHTQSGGSSYTVEDYSLWTATPYTLLWSSNSSGCTGQASGTTTITVGGVTKTTNPAFFYEPDVLLGGTTDGYAEELANYQSEYNADYDPTIFLGYGTGSGNYAASGTRADGLGLEYNQFDMTKGVVYLGSVLQNLMNETGKVNRYDQGTYEIAVNYDKFDRGLYYYVLSQIESGDLIQIRYASDLSYDSDTGIYTVTLGTGRTAQHASGLGVDIFNLLEDGYTFSDGTVVEASEITTIGMGNRVTTSTGFYLTSDQLIEILNAPTAENEAATGVIIDSSASSVDPTGVLSDAGVRFLDNLPSCIYSMGVQTVENGMGIPYYAGFFYYEQDPSLNPVSYIYYWMEHFYHVSDNEAMDEVITNMLEEADLPGSLTADASHADAYSSTEIEDQIVAGIEYYENDLLPYYNYLVRFGQIESDSALFWSTLDTSVGIGSDVRDTNADYECTSGESFEDEYGNEIYSFTFTSTASDDSDSADDEDDANGSDGTDDNSDSGNSGSTVVSSNGDTLVVRRGNMYYFSYSLKSGEADKVIAYGKATDEVLIGDWDGDGVDTLCVRRGNTYYFSNSLKSGDADYVVSYGKATDEVLVGDWDGDGKDTLCVRRGNTYYFSNTIKSGDADSVIAYGKASDSVLVGKWSGNASGTAAVKDTLCVRRGNSYYFSYSLKAGDADKVIAYGKATDEVLVGDWNADGADTLTVRRGNTYYFSYSLKNGDADKVIAYGKATDDVYAGTWQ